MADIAKLDSAVNALTREGKIIDSLKQYYADDCTFQEGNADPIVGKSTQIDRLTKMFAGLTSFNGATLHGQAVTGDRTMSEWTFDMTGADGEAVLWNEVLVRQWKNGQIAAERYYQA